MKKAQLTLRQQPWIRKMLWGVVVMTMLIWNKMLVRALFKLVPLPVLHKN